VASLLRLVLAIVDTYDVLLVPAMVADASAFVGALIHIGNALILRRLVLEGGAREMASIAPSMASVVGATCERVAAAPTAAGGVGAPAQVRCSVASTRFFNVVAPCRSRGGLLGVLLGCPGSASAGPARPAVCEARRRRRLIVCHPGAVLQCVAWRGVACLAILVRLSGR
jgi:hypothetical protein